MLAVGGNTHAWMLVSCEEFAILLPASDMESAAAVAQKLHSAIKSLGIVHKYSAVSDIVTASMGVATLVPKDKRGAAALIEAADQALYRAKRAGRNRFEVFAS